jgi:hypothetical protein
MKKAALGGVMGLCISLAACGGRGNADGEEGHDNEFTIAGSTPITETGCLTASGDRYVLTALERGGNAETELYQLVGNTDELRKHVGREVRVTGDAEPGQRAELQQPTESTPAGTSGSTGGARAQTRVETRLLRVATVTATGDECPGAAQTR